MKENDEYTIRYLGGHRWTLGKMTSRGPAGYGVFESPEEARDYAEKIGAKIREQEEN